MQAAAVGHDLFAGLQVQVKGVGEHHLGAGGLELGGRHTLHRGQGAHRHEPRCVHHPMGGVKATAAGAGVRAVGRDLEREHQRGSRIG